MEKMTSSKPYLIRALYNWIVDNELTPYVLVNAYAPDVQVPQAHVTDGRIVLNISPTATHGLIIENDKIIFTARFSGQPFQIYVPPYAILAIYAKENGRGMEFPPDEDGDGLPPPSNTTPKNKKPSLKLVK